MKNSNYFLKAALATAFLLTAACNVDLKAKDNPAPPAPLPETMSEKSQGDWSTECMNYPFGYGTYYVITLNFDNKNMTYEEQYFRDSQCEYENSEDRKTLKGTYHVSQILSDGSKAIELRIPLQQNAWTTREFNLLPKGDLLMLSEFYNSVFDDPKDFSSKYTLSKTTTDGSSGSDDAPDDGAGDDSGSNAPINDLRHGRYEVTSGHEDFCAQRITSTGKRDDKLFMIFMELEGSCSASLQFNCEDLVCTSSGGYFMELLSTSSYKFTGGGDSAIFERIEQ